MPRFGNIGKQYFDDSGDPLINGKLHFYEAGTYTLKNTYADVNLAIANTNPVILSASGRQPNIFFDGSARVVLTDKDDIQIEVRDPEGAALTSNFDNWNPDVNYASGRIVIYTDGNYYRSNVSNNLNNIPPDNADKWEQIKFLQVWNSNITYPVNRIVVGSDGIIYRAIQQNTNQNPVSTTGYWAFTTTSGTGGATESSSGTDVTLLSTDNRMQSITTTAANLDVTLPDATLLNKGTPTFVIENAGDNTFHLRANGGGYLASLISGNIATLSLRDNATSAGEWAITFNKKPGYLIDSTAEVINATASGPVSIDRLSDTRAICAYAVSPDLLHLVVLDASGTSGTPVSIETTSTSNSHGVRIKALNSTTAVLINSFDTNGTVYGRVVTISGLTPSVGSNITVSSSTDGFGLSLDVRDSSSLICGYTKLSTDQVDSRVLSVSGTTLSAGTEAVVSGSNSIEYQDYVALNATDAVIMFEQLTTFAIKIRNVDITGTPSPQGSELTLSSYPDPSAARTPRMYHLTGSLTIVCYYDARPQKIFLHVLDCFGTSPVESDALTIDVPFPAVDGAVNLTVISASRLVISYAANTRGLHAFTVDVDANNKLTLDDNAHIVLDTGADSTVYYHDIIKLTSTLAICAYIGGNTYLNAKTLEVKP